MIASYDLFVVEQHIDVVGCVCCADGCGLLFVVLRLLMVVGLLIVCCCDLCYC